MDVLTSLLPLVTLTGKGKRGKKKAREKRTTGLDQSTFKAGRLHGIFRDGRGGWTPDSKRVSWRSEKDQLEGDIKNLYLGIAGSTSKLETHLTENRLQDRTYWFQPDCPGCQQEPAECACSDRDGYSDDEVGWGKGRSSPMFPFLLTHSHAVRAPHRWRTRTTWRRSCRECIGPWQAQDREKEVYG